MNRGLKALLHKQPFVIVFKGPWLRRCKAGFTVVSRPLSQFLQIRKSILKCKA